MLARLDRTYLALFREYPQLVQLGLVTGAGQIAFALLNIYALPVYLVQDLHVSGLALGAASAIFLVTEMALKFPLGQLSDRFGRRPFIAFGPLAICLNPTIIASLPVRWWALVFPLRAADGVGAAALWPPLFAMVGDLVGSRSRAAAMGVLNAIYIGAIGAAAALGAFTAYITGSTHAAFYLASALLAISGAVGYFGLAGIVQRDKKETPASGNETHTPANDLPGKWHPTFPLAQVLLISLLMTLGVLMLPNFIILYLKTELGLSDLRIGALLVTLGAPVLVMGLPLGHAADRWGRPLAVRVSLVISAAFMWLVPCCRSVSLFGLIALVLVISHVLGTPAWLALVSEIAPTRKRGGVMGLVATAEGAGATLGPLLGGWLWDMNPTYIFYGSAALLTLAAITAGVTLQGGERRA